MSVEHSETVSVEYLFDIFPDIHREKPVEFSGRHLETANKRDLVGHYIGNLVENHSWFNSDVGQADVRKDRLAKKLQISEADIPESVINYTQIQNPNVDESEIYDIAVRNAHRNQQASLTKWIDYFKSNTYYPAWFKYYSLRSVQKMGVYDAENSRFFKRSNTTVSPFPMLNPEAVGIVFKKFNRYSEAKVKLIEALPTISGVEGLKFVADRMYNGNTLVAYSDVKKIIKAEKRDFKSLDWTKPDETTELPDAESYFLDKFGFSKLYAEALDEAKGRRMLPELRKITNGKWMSFKSINSVGKVESMLSGWGTQWCIASGQAANYLDDNGRLQIFFSQDLEGYPVVPRITIASRANRIIELRGILTGQALEPEMAFQAITAIGKYDNSDKYINDLENLIIISEIHEKNALGQVLSVSELRLLYQIDKKIIDFGYEFAGVDDEIDLEIDSRILDIISTRDVSADLDVMMVDEPILEKLNIALTVDEDAFWKLLINAQDKSLTNQVFELSMTKKPLENLIEKFEKLPKFSISNNLAADFFAIRLYSAQLRNSNKFLPSSIFDLFEEPTFGIEVADTIKNNYNIETVTYYVDKFTGLGDEYALQIIDTYDNGVDYIVDNIESFSKLSKEVVSAITSDNKFLVSNRSKIETEELLENILHAFDSSGKQQILDSIEELALQNEDIELVSDDDYIHELAYLEEEDEDQYAD